MPKETKSFITSNEVEVIEGLCLVAELLPRTNDQPYMWKWIVVAMNSVIQNSLILAVADSSQTNVLANGKKVYAALRDENLERTDERLLDFNSLLKLAQSDAMCRYSISRKLVLTDRQKASIDDLHRRFRNNFEHFTPKSMILVVDGFEEMLADCTDVVEFLIFQSGNVFLEKSENERLVDAFLQIRKQLGELAQRP